jgi:hypothetical protein
MRTLLIQRRTVILDGSTEHSLRRACHTNLPPPPHHHHYHRHPGQIIFWVLFHVTGFYLEDGCLLGCCIVWSGWYWLVNILMMEAGSSSETSASIYTVQHPRRQPSSYSSPRESGISTQHAVYKNKAVTFLSLLICLIFVYAIQRCKLSNCNVGSVWLACAFLVTTMHICADIRGQRNFQCSMCLYMQYKESQYAWRIHGRTLITPLLSSHILCVLYMYY